MKEKALNNDEMFDQLVENAIDFLSKALSEIENKPKYSVIHFYSAVELFIKARLMKEHWTLVISSRQEPDWDKFIVGDFQSVSLNEADSKLKKIVRSGLSKSELVSFKEVAYDRNKMVHFFHEEHSKEQTGKIKSSIVKKQLKAWHYLHQLLVDKWKIEFSSCAKKIEALDMELKKLQEYLNVIFDRIKPKIDNNKKNGYKYDDCPSCGFKAQERCEEEKELYEARCLVCDLVQKCLNIQCPECNEVVILKDEGFGRCKACKKGIEPSDIVPILYDSAGAYIAVTHGDDSHDLGNCSECEGYHTVVKTKNEEWICASCFRKFASMEFCEWCSEPNTGDMENSHQIGCNHCDGLAGWRKDD